MIAMGFWIREQSQFTKGGFRPNEANEQAPRLFLPVYLSEEQNEHTNTELNRGIKATFSFTLPNGIGTVAIEKSSMLCLFRRDYLNL